MSFDPADPAFLDDPYPTFAALRAVAPVHEHPLLGTPVAVSHAACSAVLRSRDLGRIWADAEPPLTHVGSAAYSGSLINALRAANP